MHVIDGNVCATARQRGVFRAQSTGEASVHPRSNKSIYVCTCATCVAPRAPRCARRMACALLRHDARCCVAQQVRDTACTAMRGAVRSPGTTHATASDHAPQADDAGTARCNQHCGYETHSSASAPASASVAQRNVSSAQRSMPIAPQTQPCASALSVISKVH